MKVLWRICWLHRHEVLRLRRADTITNQLKQYRFFYLDTFQLPPQQAVQIERILNEAARSSNPEYLMRQRNCFRHFFEQIEAVEARMIHELVDLVLFVRHYMEDERGEAYPPYFFERNFGRYRSNSGKVFLEFENKLNWSKEGF
jgi:hypothetical protein